MTEAVDVLPDLAGLDPVADAVLTRPPRVRVCALDGIPLWRHSRCRGCGLLLGPGHYCEQAVNGLCSHCAAYERRREVMLCR